MRYQQKQRHFSRRVILMEKYFVDMEQEKMWKFFFLCFLFGFLSGFFLRTPKRFRSPVISQTLSFRDSELDACVTNNDSSWNQLDILNVCRKLSTYLPHTKMTNLELEHFKCLIFLSLVHDSDFDCTLKETSASYISAKLGFACHMFHVIQRRW